MISGWQYSLWDSEGASTATSSASMASDAPCEEGAANLSSGSAVGVPPLATSAAAASPIPPRDGKTLLHVVRKIREAARAGNTEQLRKLVKVCSA